MLALQGKKPPHSGECPAFVGTLGGKMLADHGSQIVG